MLTSRVAAVLSCLAVGVGGLLSVAPPASADGPGAGMAVQAAEAWLGDRLVADPRRFAAVLSPGFLT